MLGRRGQHRRQEPLCSGAVEVLDELVLAAAGRTRAWARQADLLVLIKWPRPLEPAHHRWGSHQPGRCRCSCVTSTRRGLAASWWPVGCARDTATGAAGSPGRRSSHCQWLHLRCGALLRNMLLLCLLNAPALPSHIPYLQPHLGRRSFACLHKHPRGLPATLAVRGHTHTLSSLSLSRALSLALQVREAHVSRSPGSPGPLNPAPPLTR